MALMRITQKRKIVDNIDSSNAKYPKQITIWSARVYTHTRVLRAVVLCGEIAPFNYADQSNPPPQTPPAPHRSIQTFPTQTVRRYWGSHASNTWTQRQSQSNRIEGCIWRQEGKKGKTQFIYSESLIDLDSWRKKYAIFWENEDKVAFYFVVVGKKKK